MSGVGRGTCMHSVSGTLMSSVRSGNGAAAKIPRSPLSVLWNMMSGWTRPPPLTSQSRSCWLTIVVDLDLTALELLVDHASEVHGRNNKWMCKFSAPVHSRCIEAKHESYA